MFFVVKGKIYIYGGMYITDTKETFAMLDISTLVWSIPPLENPNVPNLVYHTATLVDKLMFIAFGKLFYHHQAAPI